MRNFVVTSVAAVIASAALSLPPAAAMTLGSAEAIRSTVNDARSIENVICYGYGWRGPGIYPGWFRPACNPIAQAYVAPEYVPAAPIYAAPAYAGPRRCWVQTAPDRNVGYWAAC